MITNLELSEAHMIVKKNNVTEYEKRRLVQFYISIPGDTFRQRKIPPENTIWINSKYPSAREHFLNN